MKKLFKYLYFVPLILCLSIAACQKEVPANDDELPVNENVVPADENAPEGFVTLTFTVDPEVKTSVSGNTVSFVAGDKIKVYWDGGDAESNEVDLSSGSAQFTATVADGKSAYYAVYPASATASVSGETLTVGILQKQSGRFADADILVAKTASSSLNLAFHHAVSLLHFTISDGNARGITCAQFVDLANSSQLYGSVEVAFDNANAPTFTPVDNTANDVIDIETVQEGDDNYIAVLPGKTLEGFGLRLGTASTWLPGIVGENTIDLSTTRPKLSNIDNKINDGDWYITPQGGATTQDGKSWATAYPASMLGSLIHNQNNTASGTKSLARGWRIDGKTIYVAEGTVYTSSSTDDVPFICSFDGYTDGDDDTVTFMVKGGYESSGAIGGLAVFGSDNVQNTSSVRGFMFYSGTNATLDNIQISNINYSGSGAEGAAIRLDGGAHLTLRNCHITGNTSSSQGGALYIKGNSTVESNGTVFSNNTGSNGGAIRVDDGSTLTINGGEFCNNTATLSGGAICAVGTTSITSCSFSNNMAGTHGGAIWAAVNPINTLSECAFVSNKAATTATAGDGGAIYSNGISIKADKCKFLNNYVQKGNSSNKNKNGAIRIGEESFFNSCEFRGNNTSYATAGKVIYNASSSITIGFNNCLFFNNGSTANWTIFSAGPVIMVNSTVIDASNGAELLRTTNTSSILYNNIVINTGTASKAGIGNCAMTHDYNIVNAYNVTTKSDHEESGVTSLGDGTAKEYDTFAAGKADGVSTGMSYYYWNGATPAFTQTDKEAIKTALSGTDFLIWLNSLNALDTDIRGVARSNGYWPGSYQAN